MAAVSSKRSVMTFYSDPESLYSHRARMVLAEKNITVEIIDSALPEQLDDLMELNPYGTLPTLVDRDLVLYDSRIIMEYLDDRFPHPPLLPVDPVARAKSRLLMHRVERDWYQHADQILAQGKNVDAARKHLLERLIQSAPVFAALPFFMSEEFSLVDCSIAPLLWRLPAMGIKLPAKSTKPVQEYATRLFARESFRNSLTELEIEMRTNAA
ncbi:MAG: glutathione S-transferase N-terminal domain-containing protein [gamma proteobacterium symbiont of Bathyaustriella thionipta]|nr:glutathione S-transferase N-terminal domain-containing protein [gamma proteobacterium symbiont of Bathyaustriella thionipta]